MSLFAGNFIDNISATEISFLDSVLDDNAVRITATRAPVAGMNEPRREGHEECRA